MAEESDGLPATCEACGAARVSGSGMRCAACGQPVSRYAAAVLRMTESQVEAREAFDAGYRRAASDHVDWAGIRVGLMAIGFSVGVAVLVGLTLRPGGVGILLWGPGAWGIWKILRSLKMS